MRLTLPRLIPCLALLLSAACADAPTLTTADPGSHGPQQHVTPLPGDGACDPMLDLGWCQDPGEPDNCITARPGEDIPDGHAAPQGCETGGGPGGAQPPPPDTCQTGDAVLDDPAVQAGLRDLWTRSNASAPQDQRREQAAWLVRRSDGSFGMVPFEATLQRPCEINGNFNAPPGAVAWVHTHPFTRREVQTICGAIKQLDPVTGRFRDVIGLDGLPVYPVYSNRPSIPDYNVMRTINRPRSDLGLQELWGLVIDANQTTLYSFDPSEKPIPFPRCGY